MTFRFASVAHLEIRAALEYYERQQAGLGARFLDEVESAISRILAMPQAWRPLSARTRRCLLHGFPFGIVYQIRGEEILAVSLMDLRRDPDSWQHLL